MKKKSAELIMIKKQLIVLCLKNKSANACSKLLVGLASEAGEIKKSEGFQRLLVKPENGCIPLYSTILL